MSFVFQQDHGKIDCRVALPSGQMYDPLETEQNESPECSARQIIISVQWENILLPVLLVFPYIEVSNLLNLNFNYIFFFTRITQ